MYYTYEYKKMCVELYREGNCYDNCLMETIFGRLKNEMFYGHEKEYTSFEKFSEAMDEYIRYYNNERIQAKTNWMPPVKYRFYNKCWGKVEKPYLIFIKN